MVKKVWRFLFCFRVLSSPIVGFGGAMSKFLYTHPRAQQQQGRDKIGLIRRGWRRISVAPIASNTYFYNFSAYRRLVFCFFGKFSWWVGCGGVQLDFALVGGSFPSLLL